MPSCVAFGCSNSTNKFGNRFSFHSFPNKTKKPLLYKAWVDAVGRESLPKTGKLCSAHFKVEDYKLSSLFKTSFPELSKFSKSYMILNDDAVPSIFAHKKPVNTRHLSKKRSERKEQQEVSVVFFLVKC